MFCSALWNVQRVLAVAIWWLLRVELTDRLRSQVLGTPSTASEVYRKFGLYCYHLCTSGWNLTERAIQSNRELGRQLPSGAACPGTVHYWFQKPCPQTGSDLPDLSPIYPRELKQVVEGLHATEWSSWSRSQTRVHAHLESGFEKDWAGEMSWNLRVPRLLFHLKWNQCLHYRLTTCEIWKSNGA